MKKTKIENTCKNKITKRKKYENIKVNLKPKIYIGQELPPDCEFKLF